MTRDVWHRRANVPTFARRLPADVNWLIIRLLALGAASGELSGVRRRPAPDYSPVAKVLVGCGG